MVAVTLTHHQGYFRQRLGADGWQQEISAAYDVRQHCRELPERATLCIAERLVQVRAWEFWVTGCNGYRLRVLLLDTAVSENTEQDRRLTDHLYGGDETYRLSQEMVLGIGGVRMLRALNYHEVARFHMNEGHAALLGWELLQERARWFHRDTFTQDDIIAIKRRCVFTTHTPVPAGHDRFPKELAVRLLGKDDLFRQAAVARY